MSRLEKQLTYRGVVQLVESRSPKPLVLGSSPSAPAKKHGASLAEALCFLPEDAVLEAIAQAHAQCDRVRIPHAGIGELAHQCQVREY